jgi:hypothetical protein
MMNQGKGIHSASFIRRYTLICAALISLGLAQPSCAQDNEQAQIDALTKKKNILQLQSDIAKLEVDKQKNAFPKFDDDFGKKGALTIESAERDKFHVTARSAEAFPIVASKLVEIVAAQPGPVVLLTDLDLAALAVYRAEKSKLDRLYERAQTILGKTPSKPKSLTPEAAGAAIMGVGSLLGEIAQFTQLFRTDKSVSFTESLLPDNLVFDLVAMKSPSKIIYPTVQMDALIAGRIPSQFADEFSEVVNLGREITQLKDKKKEQQATAFIADLDATVIRLASLEVSSKQPILASVLRGELAKDAIDVAKGRILTINVVTKGGTSLKTSSIWRSDRLYASGGLIVTYRLVAGDSTPTVIDAGAIVSESKFVEVKLD